MTRVLDSFKIQKDGKILDYRLGENLNLDKIKDYFRKNYYVKKLWQGSRHILGILEKDNVIYFLKLSTSEGISTVTKNEYKWNEFFNKNFLNKNFVVPKNYDSGIYQQKYFYIITDYFKGELLCDVKKFIPQVIKLSELIQKLPGKEVDFQEKFMDKTEKWFGDIPVDISKKYDIKTLFKIAEDGIIKLSAKVRHGDFTPWHLIKLPDGKLGLIDGEHFLVNGVENYDICYFIQRVFSVLKNPDIAKEIYNKLLEKGSRVDKLRVVLAARAIGGFLDESLSEKPDYKFAQKFKDWILRL